MGQSYFDKNGNLCFVQYAIKVRREGVPEEELIKHYFDIPIAVAKEVNTNQDVTALVGSKVSFDIKYAGVSPVAKVEFTKGSLGSIEMVVDEINAKEAVNRLFNNKVRLRNSDSFFLKR